MAPSTLRSKNRVRAVSMGRSRVPGVGRMPSHSRARAPGSPPGLCGRSIRTRVSATAWLVRDIPGALIVRVVAVVVGPVRIAVIAILVACAGSPPLSQRPPDPPSHTPERTRAA